MAKLIIPALILITLGLVVVFVLIGVMRGGTLGQIEKLTSVFSTEKRGDELTPSVYERMIKGYQYRGQQIEEFQMCKRFNENLFDEYSEFMENTMKDDKKVYCKRIT